MKRTTKSSPAGASSGTSEVDTEPATGQKRIPGMEITVVDELVDFGLRRENVKAKHATSTKELEALKHEGAALFERHKKYFEEDGKGGYIYEAGGVRITGKAGEFSINTKLVNTPDVVSAPKAADKAKKSPAKRAAKKK